MPAYPPACLSTYLPTYLPAKPLTYATTFLHLIIHTVKYCLPGDSANDYDLEVKLEETHERYQSYFIFVFIFIFFPFLSHLYFLLTLSLPYTLTLSLSHTLFLPHILFLPHTPFLCCSRMNLNRKALKVLAEESGAK